MKVSATLKGQPDGQDRYAIYIRVADGKNRVTTATKYRVLDSQFEKGKVVKHPQAAEINAALRVMIAKKEIGSGKQGIGAEFADYVDHLISEFERQRSYETIRQYKAEKTKLRSFRKHINLLQIDSEFLRSYAAYCRGLGNQENTVWKSFKFMRMLLRKALKEKVITENPFDSFAMPKYRDPKKTYLTIDQIHIVERKLPEMADMKLVASWFLIG